MPHTIHVYGRLSEQTMETAKIFLALCDDKEAGERIESINQELDEAKLDLFSSLKSNEGLAYVYLRYPHEFSELCVNVVEAMREHSRIQGNPFKSKHHLSPANFPVEPNIKEDELIHYIYEKKVAFDHLEGAVLESIKKTMGVLASDDEPAKYLVPAIAGILARQMVSPSKTGSKILDDKAEKEAFDSFSSMLRPHITTALNALSNENQTVPESIRDKIMSDVICTDFFLMKLQLKPATSFIQTKAVG